MYNLEIAVENMEQIRLEQGNHAFSILRKVGFGASDSSILLGVNPFDKKGIPGLIEAKQRDIPTEDELAIGKMVNVRKGVDLEDLILEKSGKILQYDVEKPPHMYRISGTHLTINYDGIAQVGESLKVPVEVKFVSMYGKKYYDWSKFQTSTEERTRLYDIEPLGDEVNSIYLTKRAKEAGIPIYYYTQVQQQMMGINAPFAYIAVVDDKTWEFGYFIVMADEKVWQELLDVSNLVGNKIW